MKECPSEYMFLSYVDDLERVFLFKIEEDGAHLWSYIDYDENDIPQIHNVDIPLRIDPGYRIMQTCNRTRDFYAGCDDDLIGFDTESQAYAMLMKEFMFSEATYNPAYIVCFNHELQEIIDTYPGREVFVYVTD